MSLWFISYCSSNGSLYCSLSAVHQMYQTHFYHGPCALVLLSAYIFPFISLNSFKSAQISPSQWDPSWLPYLIMQPIPHSPFFLCTIHNILIVFAIYSLCLLFVEYLLPLRCKLLKVVVFTCFCSHTQNMRRIQQIFVKWINW